MGKVTITYYGRATYKSSYRYFFLNVTESQSGTKILYTHAVYGQGKHRGCCGEGFGSDEGYFVKLHKEFVINLYSETICRRFFS